MKTTKRALQAKRTSLENFVRCAGPAILGVPGHVHARWGKAPRSRLTEAGCKPPLSGGGQEPLVVSVEGKGVARPRQV